MHNKFTLGLTYLDAEYGDYLPMGQGNPPNFRGRPLDDSRKYTANLGYTYTQPLNTAGILELSVHSYFSASYVLSDVAIPVIYRQPAYHITDVKATWSVPGDKWYLEAYARNLENKIVVVNVNPNAAVPSAPLTFGFRVGFHY
jgi:iron complex outermembrane receptor protein